MKMNRHLTAIVCFFIFIYAQVNTPIGNSVPNIKLIHSQGDIGELTVNPMEVTISTQQNVMDTTDGKIAIDMSDPRLQKIEVSLEIEIDNYWSSSVSPDYFEFYESGEEEFNVEVEIPWTANRTNDFKVIAICHWYTLTDDDIIHLVTASWININNTISNGGDNNHVTNNETDNHNSNLPYMKIVGIVIILTIVMVILVLLIHRRKT